MKKKLTTYKMKKLFIAVAIILVSFAANAQSTAIHAATRPACIVLVRRHRLGHAGVGAGCAAHAARLPAT
ncbi:MAG: hypothetical protein ABI793_14420, partial [Flavobacterium sp.]